jgi:hypothetical protein
MTDNDNDGNAPHDEKRPAAILTPAQRELLLGTASVPNRASERAMKARIRDRVQSAILDFPIVLNHLDRSDIEAVFEEPVEVELGATFPIRNSIPYAIGLFYLSVVEAEKKGSQPEGWRFSHTVESGLEMALNQAGVSVEDITVDIDIERGTELEELSTSDLSEQPRRVLQQLLFAGEITDEEFVAAFQNRTPADE